MIYTVFDVESDGLIDEATKIHCLSYEIYSDKTFLSKGTIIKYSDIVSFIKSQTTLVGHNIIRYDIPLLEKLLNIKIEASLIDTLALSWYLFSTENIGGKIAIRERHGLEDWGNFFKVPKPVISDWKNLSIEDYKHRCETDVRINTLLFFKQIEYLKKIYDNNENHMVSLIKYLSFKLDCAREQEENPLYIDTEKLEKELQYLTEQVDQRTQELSDNMPLQHIYKTVTRPKKERFYKKDGSLSVVGQRWKEYQEEYSLDDSVESVDILVSTEAGNPNSSQQLKDWLLSLGWEPTYFKESKSKVTEKIKKVPQVLMEDKELCPNIKKLIPNHPYLQALEDLSLLNHRKGVVQSFSENLLSNGTARATIGGFTSTLRFQHRKPIVNLPKVGVFYGEEIRSLIVAPRGYSICGNDMSALEDTTKQHYMYFFDPEYVKEMRVPGFDPHVDIAIFGKLMTEEEAKTFKELKKKKDRTEKEDKEFHRLSDIRYQGKRLNFASIYGSGAAKLSQLLEKPLSFTTKLHKAYWDRNKAVKEVTDNIITKVVDGNMWLYNPVSTFWYPLRYEKDKFSGLNQSTGVYCFDRYVFHIRKQSIKISLQYHDEIGFYFSNEEYSEEQIRAVIAKAIEETNNEVKLNVPLGSSADFGQDYSQVH